MTSTTHTVSGGPVYCSTLQNYGKSNGQHVGSSDTYSREYSEDYEAVRVLDREDEKEEDIPIEFSIDLVQAIQRQLTFPGTQSCWFSFVFKRIMNRQSNS